MASNQQPALDTTDTATDRSIPAGLADVAEALLPLCQNLAAGICPKCGQQSLTNRKTGLGIADALVQCSQCTWCLTKEIFIATTPTQPAGRIAQVHLAWYWLLKALAAQAQALRLTLLQLVADQAPKEPGLFDIDVHEFCNQSPTWTELKKLLPADQVQQLLNTWTPIRKKALFITPGRTGKVAPYDETNRDYQQYAKPKSRIDKKRVPRLPR